MRILHGVVWATVVLACAAGASAQSDTGAVDTRRGVAEEIIRLEQMLGGDVAAEKQAVTLRWLADLYVSVGRLDDAQRAYQRILVFFPGDPAVSNAYATFLMEQRHDPGAAEHVLRDAIQWAAATPTPPAYIGQTYALRARALEQLGRCDDAIRSTERATDLLDADAAEAALRVRAHCLAELGRNDEARDAYFSLIGLSGGSNPDDLSELIALSTTSKPLDADRFRARVQDAIERARRDRAKAAQAQGAQIVELKGEGGARLEATLRRAKGPAAVLFVPDAGGRRTVFAPYAQLMSLDGVTTLTVDPRGQGDSRCDSLPSYALLTADQRDRLPADVDTAYRYLQDTVGVAPDRIAIVSEGYACGIVARAIHEYGIAPVVVQLSPIVDPDDRDLDAALSFRPPRPMLAVASDEDTFAMRSIDRIRTDSTQRVPPDTHVFHFAGHGVQILREPANYAVVANWIERALGVNR